WPVHHDDAVVERDCRFLSHSGWAGTNDRRHPPRLGADVATDCSRARRLRETVALAATDALRQERRWIRAFRIVLMGSGAEVRPSPSGIPASAVETAAAV